MLGKSLFSDLLTQVHIYGSDHLEQCPPGIRNNKNQ